MIPAKLTRGERNGNPGNIREYVGDRTAWKGERATDDDKEFEEFVFKDPSDPTTAQMGIRALAKVILSYERKYGIRTVRGVVYRWAPSNENDTEAYIRSVADRMRVGDVEALDLTSKATLVDLVTAIIFHENGRCIYPQQVVEEGVAAAL